MAQTFKAKTLVSSTGTFSYEATAPNLVYNTGDQIISGVKTFANDLSIKNNLFFISQASGYISGLNYDGNYNGGIYIGRTRLSQSTLGLIENSFSTKWNPSAGNAGSTSRNWKRIVINDQGKYQVGIVSGGTIYVSDNYGESWPSKTSIVGPSNNWSDVAISSDGKYLIACVDGGYVWLSDSYGTNWTQSNILGTGNWKCVSLNSSAQYQTALSQDSETTGSLWISKNYGTSWSSYGITGKNASSATMSSDGKYQRIALYSNENSLYSNDYGNTWTSTIQQTTGCSHTRISSDGSYQLLTTDEYVKISKDYGVTWVDEFRTPAPANKIKDLTISANAHFQVIALENNYLYASYNYGESGTWNQVGLSGNWSTIDVSSNGKTLTAAMSGVTSGFIFLSNTDEQIRGDLYADNIKADNLVYNTGNQIISGVTFNGNLKILNTLELNSINNSNYYDQPKIIIGNAGLLKGTGPQASLEYRAIALGANITASGNGADIKKVYNGTASPTLQLSAGPANYSNRNGMYFSNNISSSSINQFNNLMFIDMETGSSTYGAIRIGNFGATNRNTPSTEVGYALQVDGNIKAANLAYNTGNQIISGVKTFATGIVAPNLVYNTGNQTISGVKTFNTNIEVQQTGIFNSLDLSNISSFDFSGTNINLISGAINIKGDCNVTGTIYVSGVPITTEVTENSYKNLYISPNGNNATALIGNINRPYLTAQAAYSAVRLDPNPAYILNFFGGSYWSITITGAWPIGIGIRGVGNGGFFSNQGKPFLSLTQDSFQSPIPTTKIVDFGNKSISLSIYSNAQGGNKGGDIYLYNGLASQIESFGAAGAIGGVGGDIYLYNSEVTSVSSLGATGSGPSANRGGGNIYIENSKISTTLNHNSDPVNSRTIKIINSIYPSLPSTSATFDIKNSYNTGSQGVLSSNYSGSYYYDNFSIKNNTLSGVLNNLTLHDNQNRVHLTGKPNTLSVDFSGGLNIANNVNCSDINKRPTGNLCGYNFYPLIGSLSSTGLSSLNLNGVVGGPMTRSAGINGFASVDSWGSDSYTIGAANFSTAIANNEYFTIPIYSIENNEIKISGIDTFTVDKSTSGPSHVAFLYGTGISPSSLGTVVYTTGAPLSPGTPIDVSLEINKNLNSNPAIIPANTTGYFFIVPFGATANGGRLLLKSNYPLGNRNDLSFIGSVSVNPLLTIDSSVKISNNLDLANSKLLNFTQEIININSNFLISGYYNSKILLANSSNQITGSIISGNTSGFNVSITQIGNGQIFITGSGIGVPIGSYNNQYKTAGKFATISLLNTGNNGYIMYGNTAL